MENDGYYLEFGEKRYPIEILHWWPGRQYHKDTELSDWQRRRIAKAYEYGSCYLTLAECNTPYGLLRTKSQCMSVDIGRKSKKRNGINKAIGRMYGQALKHDSGCVLIVPEKTREQVVGQITDKIEALVRSLPEDSRECLMFRLGMSEA